ncbi:hypothetical protein ABGB07_42365 [Micromonosporaceae bacterium B7E4]
MTRLIRVGSVAASVVLALLGLGVLAPSTAAAADEVYTVHVDAGEAWFDYRLCLKTTTTVRDKSGTHWDRSCVGRKSGWSSADLTAKYTPGDTVWMDLEMFMNLHDNSSKTKDDVDITGAHNCTLSGPVHAGKFKCDGVDYKTNFSLPEIDPYVAHPDGFVLKLLDLMAWCVSAAGVIGLLITGTTIASSLRHGALEEKVEYIRHIAIVLAACLIATTAGPVIEWLALVE